MIHLKWVNLIYNFFHNKLVVCVLFVCFLSLGETGENTSLVSAFMGYKAEDLCFRNKGQKESEGRQDLVMDWDSDSDMQDANRRHGGRSSKVTGGEGVKALEAQGGP